MRWGGERNATPRDFAPPAATSVKRECSLASPMPGHALEARGGHEQRGLRVAHPERAQPLEVLRKLQAEVAPRHDRVHPLDRDQVLR